MRHCGGEGEQRVVREVTKGDESIWKGERGSSLRDLPNGTPALRIGLWEPFTAFRVRSAWLRREMSTVLKFHETVSCFIQRICVSVHHYEHFLSLRCGRASAGEEQVMHRVFIGWRLSKSPLLCLVFCQPLSCIVKIYLYSRISYIYYENVL